MSAPTDPGLPAGAVEAAEWADVGHPRQFRLFNGRKRVVTWRDAEDGTPGQAELYVAGSQLADGSLEGPRHVRVSGIDWTDAIPADAAREFARSFAELAAEIEAVQK